MHNAAKLKRCLVARRSTGNCNTPAQGIRPRLNKVASDVGTDCELAAWSGATGCQK